MFFRVSGGPNHQTMGTLHFDEFGATKVLSVGEVAILQNAKADWLWFCVDQKPVLEIRDHDWWGLGNWTSQGSS
jgi:hypothetical protein